MEDLRNSHIVEIEIKENHTNDVTFWVNVDGKCALRIQKAEFILVRTSAKEKFRIPCKPERESIEIITGEECYGKVPQ